jgi:hypothetical protein
MWLQLYIECINLGYVKRKYALRNFWSPETDFKNSDERNEISNHERYETLHSLMYKIIAQFLQYLFPKQETWKSITSF